MILYLSCGLLAVFAVLRLYGAMLPNRNGLERLGSHANLAAYALAVLLPFDYILMAAVFGYWALFMLALGYEATLAKRLGCSAAALALLLCLRALPALLGMQGPPALAVFALSLFCASSLALEARRGKRAAALENELAQERARSESAAREAEERRAGEVAEFKAAAALKLRRALALLDRFQVEEAERTVRGVLEGELADSG